MKRLVVKNGTTVDGSGAAPYAGDVIIDGQKIEAVGPQPDLPPDTPVINATGCIVCPGFIDTHSHSDF